MRSRYYTVDEVVNEGQGTTRVTLQTFWCLNSYAEALGVVGVTRTAGIGPVSKTMTTLDVIRGARSGR